MPERDGVMELVSGDPEATRRLMNRWIDESDFSRAGVARRMGITRYTLNGYLHGQKERAGLEWFARFCAAVGRDLMAVKQ